jgi:hypothetical protein
VALGGAASPGVCAAAVSGAATSWAIAGVDPRTVASASELVAANMCERKDTLIIDIPPKQPACAGR